MYFRLDPEVPEPHLVHRVARILAAGGLAIVPTDTHYALVCDVGNRLSTERMRELKGLPAHKPFSILLADLAELGTYAGYVSSATYRTLKRILPGPYTLIVPASDQVPKLLHSRRRTVGLRVPECPITLALIRALGRPLVGTSLPPPEVGAMGDPDELERVWGGVVDAVIDGGVLASEPSTVVDLSVDPPAVTRVGRGDPSWFE